MASSLEKLASYLDKYEITRKVFKEDDYSDDQISLLTRKGVFPYDYVESFEKLQEQELPAKEDFKSRLYDSEISDSDYSHAQNIWQQFNINTLGEYSDLYLKTDVLLLADVFENFRSTCLQAYGLDPAQYYTTPGLTWDAMLHYTGIQLELLTDIDMLLFIEKGIRGGVSQCCNRYAEANNRYMKEGYDPSTEEKYLMYFDVNALYSWAMTQYLPFGKFEWVKDINKRDFFKVSDTSDVGYVLEVDLEYPENIHDDHKDLPLCPEHRAPPGSKFKKLLTTLTNKERYVIHYRALKQAIDNGLKLKKIHRALKFKQSPWLKPYVDFNTTQRTKSKNEFEKNFYKLLNNAVYGKTMENERKRIDVKLVSKWSGRYGAEALIAHPNFHSRSIFDENLVAVQLARTEITIMKPIYVGLCVLDVSKTNVYEFHYSYMRERFAEKCKLLYTDTDSLIYEVRGNNIYEMMREDSHKFDTSDYPVSNQFGIQRLNKKVAGIMKDENNGKIMRTFIGLRSKMYCTLVDESEPTKKAKGVKGCIVKNQISFEDYRDCLFEGKILKCLQNNIRSRNHIVHTERQNKIALSPYDDKRYLLQDSTDTLPWGHKDIPQEVEKEEQQAEELIPSAVDELESRMPILIEEDATDFFDEPPAKRRRGKFLIIFQTFSIYFFFSFLGEGEAENVEKEEQQAGELIQAVNELEETDPAYIEEEFVADFWKDFEELPTKKRKFLTILQTFFQHTFFLHFISFYFISRRGGSRKRRKGGAASWRAHSSSQQARGNRPYSLHRRRLCS